MAWQRRAGGERVDRASTSDRWETGESLDRLVGKRRVWRRSGRRFAARRVPRRTAMVRRTRRTFGIRFAIIALLMVGMTGAERSARGQSELGRGPGGSVPYPYGASGGRASAPGNPASRSGQGAATTPGLPANPYAVPAMNPFLNPYAAI